MPYCKCGRQIEDFDDGEAVEWRHVNPETGEPIDVATCPVPRSEND